MVIDYKCRNHDHPPFEESTEDLPQEASKAKVSRQLAGEDMGEKSCKYLNFSTCRLVSQNRLTHFIV